ncbi:hypothetical protein G6Z94_11745 [Vibrio aestuarianus]|uniref:HP1 family phage holin n=1 Tax=Vibrio aestuarianus TaxID=28171 RepID=UPI001593C7E6|nr:HP1 family phage holin [Vibrio aestuarianus]NGZ18012.1 hypothetical protein [Vibrio aestuarianus]
MKNKVIQLVSVIKNPKVIVGVVSSVIAGVFIAKGHKLTAWIGGITASFGALSLPEWSMVIGIITALVSMFATVFFKWLNSSMLKQAIEQGKPVGHLINREGLDI